MTTPEYKPPEEEQLFQQYYDKLIWQTLHARAHLKLWERLEGYKASYLKELNQAPHFFIFTIKAHLDDAVLTLSRILDKHEDSLSIWKFLNFAEQNLKIFSNEAFAQRTRQKPDYDEHWVKSHTPITKEEIREDRQKLSSLENVINNIKGWRDNVFAHVDRDFHLREKNVSKEYPLQRQQLHDIIDTLFTTLNRYSASYSAGIFLEKYLGEDDVNIVMNAIRFRIQERKKQLEVFRKETPDKQ
jgi:hypothetical protein